MLLVVAAQGAQVPLHPMADGLHVAPELSIHPFQATSLQVRIERIKALEGRHRLQEVSAHVPHIDTGRCPVSWPRPAWYCRRGCSGALRPERRRPRWSRQDRPSRSNRRCGADPGRISGLSAPRRRLSPAPRQSRTGHGPEDGTTARTSPWYYNDASSIWSVFGPKLLRGRQGHKAVKRVGRSP